MPEVPPSVGLSLRPARGIERPDRLGPSHRRFVLKESALGTLFGGVVPALVIWLLRPPLPLPLLGADSVASSLILGTLGPAFGVPIAITLIVRYRVRRWGAPALAWPLRHPGLARLLPQPLVLRGVVTAAVAMLILPAVGLLAMMAFGVKTVSGGGFILYNFVHGLGIGALVLPATITRALADGGRTEPAAMAPGAIHPP